MSVPSPGSRSSPDTTLRLMPSSRPWAALGSHDGGSGRGGQPLGGLAPEDRALIRLLQEDGRRSFADLGRELSVPERMVQRRFQELTERGVFIITVAADPAVLGYAAGALVGVHADGSVRLRDLVRRLTAVPGVDYGVVTAGRFDGFVELLCLDHAALLDVLDESFVGAPGVAGIEVFPYMQLHGLQFDWEAAQISGSGDTSRVPVASLDSRDHELIACLQADGRIPFRKLGDRVGMSESQARKRVVRMVELGAIAITALVDPRSLGFRTQAWLGINCLPGHSPGDIAARLTGMSSVTYVVACAGRYDLFAEVICRDTRELSRIANSGIRSTAGVGDVETFLGLELYYQPVLPLPTAGVQPLSELGKQPD